MGFTVDNNYNIQNVETCGFVDDETCISMCRDSFLTLPPICDICNRKRPLLFVDMDEIISTSGRVMVDALENIINERLSTYVQLSHIRAWNAELFQVVVQ